MILQLFFILLCLFLLNSKNVTSTDGSRSTASQIDLEDLYREQDRFTLDYVLETMSWPSVAPDLDLANVTEETTESTTITTTRVPEISFKNLILETFIQSAMKQFRNENKTLQEIGFDPDKNGPEDVILNWYLSELNKTGHGNIIIIRPEENFGFIRGKELEQVLLEFIKQSIDNEKQLFVIEYTKHTTDTTTELSTLIPEETTKTRTRKKSPFAQKSTTNQAPQVVTTTVDEDLTTPINHSVFFEQYKKWYDAKKDGKAPPPFPFSPNQGAGGLRYGQGPNFGQGRPNYEQGPPNYRQPSTYMQTKANFSPVNPNYGQGQNNRNDDNYRQGPPDYNQQPPNYSQVTTNLGVAGPNYDEEQGPLNYDQGSPQYGQVAPSYAIAGPGPDGQYPNQVDGQDYREQGYNYGQGNQNYAQATQDLGPPIGMNGPPSQNMVQRSPNYGPLGQNNPNYGQRLQNIGPVNPNYGQNAPIIRQAPQNIGPQNGFSNYGAGPQHVGPRFNNPAVSNIRQEPKYNAQRNGAQNIPRINDQVYNQVTQSTIGPAIKYEQIPQNFGRGLKNYEKPDLNTAGGPNEKAVQNAGQGKPSQGVPNTEPSQNQAQIQTVQSPFNVNQDTNNDDKVRQNINVDIQKIGLTPIHIVRQAENTTLTLHDNIPAIFPQSLLVYPEDLMTKYTDPDFFRLTSSIPRQGSTSTTQEYSIGELVAGVTTSPLPTTPTQFIGDLLKQMEDTKNGYYTMFFIKLLQMVSSSKNVGALKKLVFTAEPVVDHMMKRAEFSRYGEPFNSKVVELARGINGAPLDAIQSLATGFHNYMVNRKSVGPADINAIFDFLDANILEDEGRALFAALEEVKLFPNTTKTASEVMTDLLTAIFAPTKRLSMTNEGRALFDSINKAIAGRTGERVYPRARGDVDIIRGNNTLRRRYRESGMDIETDRNYTLEKPSLSKKNISKGEISKNKIKKANEHLKNKHPTAYKEKLKQIKEEIKKEFTKRRANKRMLKKFGIERKGYNYERHLNKVIKKEIAKNDISETKATLKQVLRRDQQRLNIVHESNKRKEFSKGFNQDDKSEDDDTSEDPLNIDIDDETDSDTSNNREINFTKVFRNFNQDNKRKYKNVFKDTVNFNIDKAVKSDIPQNIDHIKTNNIKKINFTKDFRIHNLLRKDKYLSDSFSIKTDDDIKESESDTSTDLRDGRKNNERKIISTKDFRNFKQSYKRKEKTVSDFHKVKIDETKQYHTSKYFYDKRKNNKRIYFTKDFYYRSKINNSEIKIGHTTKRQKTIKAKTKFLNLIKSSKDKIKTNILNLPIVSKKIKESKVIDEFVKRFARKSRDDKSLLKVIKEPTYTDDERELKINLKDALVHGDRNFENLRRYDNDKGIKLSDDDEIVLKKNIYKSFGFDT